MPRFSNKGGISVNTATIPSMGFVKQSRSGNNLAENVSGWNTNTPKMNNQGNNLLQPLGGGGTATNSGDVSHR